MEESTERPVPAYKIRLQEAKQHKNAFVEIPKKFQNIWFQMKKDTDGKTKMFMFNIDPITKEKEGVPIHG